MIEEALSEIERGCAEIIDNERIEKLLKAYFDEGKTYTVKAGFDPTAPDLHLGHTVLLQKLATFQKYGARVQFLIGSFTAAIGDPTGKSATRKILTKEEIVTNIESYTNQAFKILDEKPTGGHEPLHGFSPTDGEVPLENEPIKTGYRSRDFSCMLLDKLFHGVPSLVAVSQLPL